MKMIMLRDGIFLNLGGFFVSFFFGGGGVGTPMIQRRIQNLHYVVNKNRQPK